MCFKHVYQTIIQIFLCQNCIDPLVEVQAFIVGCTFMYVVSRVYTHAAANISAACCCCLGKHFLDYEPPLPAHILNCTVTLIIISRRFMFPSLRLSLINIILLDAIIIGH